MAYPPGTNTNPSGALVIGLTPVSGATDGDVLYNNDGVLGAESGGSGGVTSLNALTGAVLLENGAGAEFPISGNAVVVNVRTILTADTDFYVSTTGSDSNPGTEAEPFATIQGGLNKVAQTYDVNGFVLTFQCVDGDYAGFVFPSFISSGNQITNPYNIGVVRVIGDVTNADNVTINSIGNTTSEPVPALIICLSNNVVLCNVDSMTVDASGISGCKNFLSAAPGGNGLSVGNFDFTGTLPSSGIVWKGGGSLGADATQQGRLDISGNNSFVGAFAEVLHAEQNGVLTTGVWNDATLTAESGCTFGAFAGAGDDADAQSGLIQFQNVTFVDNGSTGLKFRSWGPQASIDLYQTFGAGRLNSLRGSEAGQCQWGGSYGYYDASGNYQLLVGNLGGTPVSQLTYTVAQLPAPNTLANNFTLTVTDLNSPTIGDEAEGGGATTGIVWWDNTGGIWRVLAIGSVAVVGVTLILNYLNAGIDSGSPSPGTSADAPAGSSIIAFVGNIDAAPRTITGLIDSAGNTYTQAAQTAGGSSSYYNCSLWYCLDTADDLPAGGTFTATTSDGSQYLIAAAVFTAINGLDQTNTNSAGTGTSISVATSTLAQSHEIVFACQYPSNNGGTFNEASGFTSFVPTQASDGLADFAFQVVESTSAVTYDPSWANSTDSTACIASFKY